MGIAICHHIAFSLRWIVMELIVKIGEALNQGTWGMGICVMWWPSQVRYFHDTCMGKSVNIFYHLPVHSLDDEQETSRTWPSRSFWWKIFEPLKGWSGVSHVFFIWRTYNTTLHVKMMGLSLTYLDMHCALSGKIIATTYNIVLFHRKKCCDKHINAWLIFLERLSYSTFHWVICVMTGMVVNGFCCIFLILSLYFELHQCTG